MTSFTSTDVLDLIAESPRDASQARTLFIPLDEGDTTWDPSRGPNDQGGDHVISRARNGGSIIGVVYVQFPDGGIAARAVQSPLQPHSATRKQG